LPGTDQPTIGGKNIQEKPVRFGNRISSNKYAGVES